MATDNVKTINLDFFQQALKAQQRNTKATYRLELEADSVTKALAMVYQTEVEERGLSCVFDEATKDCIRKVAEWLCRGRKNGLLMAGFVGNGKTTMLKAVARLFALLHIEYEDGNRRLYRNVRYVSALELTRIAADTTQKAWLEEIKRTPMLAIDDVGTEPTVVKNYGNEISPLTEVLYYRYDQRLWTMMTSNLKEEDFQERYGVRIADRIREMFNILAYNHKSYRQ